MPMTWMLCTSALYVALLGSFPLFSAPGGPSPEHTNQDQKAAIRKTEIPFELFNDHLIIVKGTIGSIGNVSIILSRMQIGALHAEFFRVIVQDLSLMERKLGISIGGIAGLDILSANSFMIDYRKRRIVFGPTEASRKAVRFDTRLPFLTVKATITGQEVRLLVDSGTSGLLLYRKRFKATLPLATNQDPSISTAAGPMPAQWFRASEVSLGKENLGPQLIVIGDLDPDPRYDFDGLLGFRNLGFRTVWFDFENGLFRWD